MASRAGKIVMFGGMVNSTATNTTLEFDGIVWRSPTTTGPVASGHAMATLGDRIIMFGGVSGGSSYLGDTWAFDGSNWSELNVSAAPSPSRRSQFSMTAVRDRILLFGGRTPLVGQDTMLLGDDGAVWTLVSRTGVARAEDPPSLESDHSRMTTAPRTQHGRKPLGSARTPSACTRSVRRR